MEYDLIVIGAGYWGTAITLQARKKGWNVIALDDEDVRSGSRNASAICDPKAYQSNVFKKYWPADWTQQDLQDSLSWLVDRGAVKTREYFWNKFAGTSIREGGEALYLPNPESLCSLAKPAKVIVEGGNTGNTIELFTSKGVFRSRCLAVAAGYRTDDMLKILGLSQVGVSSLYGRGIVASGRSRCDVPVSVMIRPYCKHTVRDWGNGFKVGDTAEKTPNPKRLEDLRIVGRAVLEDYKELQLNEGYRPVTDRFLVCKIAHNVVVATGGHRLGLGLAGLAAKKTMEALS